MVKVKRCSKIMYCLLVFSNTIFVIGFIGIYSWLWYLLISDSGLKCRLVLGSKVWLISTVLNIISGPFYSIVCYIVYDILKL